MARDRSSRPEAQALRLFLAVEVPPAAKRAVAAAIAPWREAFPRARWIPEENWHITLKFLGPTRPRLVGWVEDAAAATALASSPTRASLKGLGAFPSPRAARVCWAGIEDPAKALVRLSAGLDEALAARFPADPRGFTPHLTVARSNPPLALPAAFAATPLATEPFPIDHLVLFRTHLQRPAARYEPLRTFALGG